MLKFYKYQGTGNDFIMIDDRMKKFPIQQGTIAKLCDRRFGIGADGLILLQQNDNNYEMLYFNSDGNESSMCGNGGRCFVKFMIDLGLIKQQVKFKAIDGWHHGEFLDPFIKLKMADVKNVEVFDNHCFADTGSPHHVVFSENLIDLDVKKLGAAIRYSAAYPQGTNVNFVHQLSPNRIEIRTYERGVEDETLSCGTGVTAAALTLAALGKTTESEIKIKTQGGSLMVTFDKNGDSFSQIFLIGPAEQVFSGKIKI